MYYRARNQTAPMVAACAAGHQLARAVYVVLTKGVDSRLPGKAA